MTRPLRLPTVEQVVSVHSVMLEQHGGGCPGLRDPNALDACVARLTSGFGDAEVFPTLWTKAAAWAHGTVTSHPLIDGNKRTACAMAAILLFLNGYDLIASAGDAEETIVALALHEVFLRQLAEWLREHSVPLEQPD